MLNSFHSNGVMRRVAACQNTNMSIIQITRKVKLFLNLFSFFLFIFMTIPFAALQGTKKAWNPLCAIRKKSHPEIRRRYENLKKRRGHKMVISSIMLPPCLWDSLAVDSTARHRCRDSHRLAPTRWKSMEAPLHSLIFGGLLQPALRFDAYICFT